MIGRHKLVLSILAFTLTGLGVVFVLSTCGQRTTTLPDDSSQERQAPVEGGRQGSHRITVKGAVTEDATGQPIARAKVRCTLQDGDVIVTETSDAGMYQFEVSSIPQELHVRVIDGRSSPNTLAEATSDSIPAPDNLGRIQVDFLLTLRQRVVFSGRVTNESGHAISGASVKIEPRGSSAIAMVYSRQDGSYELDSLLLLGSYELVAESDAHQWDSRDFEFSRWEKDMKVTVNFSLGTYPIIKGRVLSPSGQVVAGASVRAIVSQTKEGVTDSAQSTVVTNARGEFSIDFDVDGDLTLSASHPMYETTNKSLGAAKGFKGVTELDIEFETFRDGLTYTGQVVDENGSAIVPDRMTLLKSVNDFNDPEREVVIPVDSQGAFQVVLDRKTRYAVTIEKRGYKTLFLDEVTAENVHELKFRLNEKQ